MHRKQRIFLCAAILFLLWPSLLFGTASIAFAEGIKKVKVAIQPYLDFAPYFIAQEEGFFADQGLDVDFIRFKVSSKALPALIQGDLDVIAGRPFAGHFNAMAEGIPLRFVADRTHLNPKSCSSNVIMARTELVRSGALNEPENWQGLKIAISSRSSPGLLVYERLLHDMELSLEDPDLIFMPGTTRLEAMMTGSIDMGTFNEPQISHLISSGKALIWKEEAQVYPDFQHAVLVYGPTFLVQDVDAGKRFMTAYLEGVRQMAEGTTERNIDIVHTHSHLEKELLRNACWPSTRLDGSIDTDSIMDMQRWFKRQGMVDTILPPDTFWDPRFVEYASGELDKKSAN